MKTIRFNFSHPVKGRASLLPLTCNNVKCQQLQVASTADNLLEVPVSNCTAGRWKLILDWEYEGRNFSHQEEFEIKGKAKKAKVN
ncbi:hypothetical protein FFF34_006640 [Inquilinus sp. KBS0705]|nr:hypothetical protein FFF34_006640 [Inquilinus sp. KBS0705]